MMTVCVCVCGKIIRKRKHAWNLVHKRLRASEQTIVVGNAVSERRSQVKEKTSHSAPTRSELRAHLPPSHRCTRVGWIVSEL